MLDPDLDLTTSPRLGKGPLGWRNRRLLVASAARRDTIADRKTMDYIQKRTAERKQTLDEDEAGDGQRRERRSDGKAHCRQQAIVEYGDGVDVRTQTLLRELERLGLSALA
ncbi:hypothetical protein LXA43DRAFT_1094552 [Ganoderma leucocontextum]|nr:hypothetical protein LXA43DRAFT_1094552 [Ganoderma leucocontextum]